MSLQGIRIGFSTNSIFEYSTVIEVFFDSISHGIFHLDCRLDSQLIILHLHNVYLVRSPTMLHMFLRVHLLGKHYDYIEYQHAPISLNTFIDAL